MWQLGGSVCPPHRRADHYAQGSLQQCWLLWIPPRLSGKTTEAQVVTVPLSGQCTYLSAALTSFEFTSLCFCLFCQFSLSSVCLEKSGQCCSDVSAVSAIRNLQSPWQSQMSHFPVIDDTVKSTLPELYWAIINANTGVLIDCCQLA